MENQITYTEENLNIYLSFSGLQITPETLSLLYLEQNLIFSGIKNLIMFWIFPDGRN